MRRLITAESLNRIIFELDELDNLIINLKGKKIRPSQCYRFFHDPPHVLYNTNCPAGLSQKIQEILERHTMDENYNP